MDFELTQEQLMFQRAIRKLAQEWIVPLVDEAEKNHKFPVELFRKMGEQGYLCITYPEEYGALGLGVLEECIWAEELGRVCCGIASALVGHSSLATAIICYHGSQELKRRYLMPAVRGEKIGAFGLTEPGAGSDAAAIEAKAVRNGDNYVLNGTKTFISNAPICDFAIIPAYTDKSLGPGKGISVFVIEKDMVGFSSSPKLEKMGNHSDETGSLYLRDCRVPASNLVGEEGRGFQYIMKGLTRGRIVHAARTLGVAVAAYESALDYAKQRVQFNQPIGKFQAISFRLARMALEIESVRWLIYRAAWLYDNGKKCNKESSMAKLLSSEVALRVADNATHIFGGYGYIAEYQVERYFRDAKIGVITQGTSEVQHILIARELGL